MAIMKDRIRQIRSKGRTDAKNRWWVVTACAKTYTHAGSEDAMQKWYEWLEYVRKMIESAEGSAGRLHKITKPRMWRRGVQILEKEEEDARLLTVVKQKEKNGQKHWQCDEDAQNMQDKPWRNEELRRCEEALPRLKEGDLEKGPRLYQAKTGVGCDGFHPKVPLDLTKETRGKIAEFLEKVE